MVKKDIKILNKAVRKVLPIIAKHIKQLEKYSEDNFHLDMNTTVALNTVKKIHESLLYIKNNLWILK